MRLKLVNKIIQEDITIRLRFEGGAWANMTFQHNKERDWWNVVISSDWGNWSYGWSRQGSGRDIYEFMNAPTGYFIDKFTGGTTRIFSINKTMTELRKLVREEYPWIKYKEENEELMYLISELEGCENEDQVFNKIDKKIYDLVDGEIWNYFKYEWHPREKFFFKKIFPKFFPEIKRIRLKRNMK